MLLSQWKVLALMLVLVTTTAFLAALALLRAIEPEAPTTTEWEPTLFTAGWSVVMVLAHTALELACLDEARDVSD